MNISEKIYLECLPYEKSHIPKSKGFKFDGTTKKWYTHEPNHNLLDDFKKIYINFKDFRKENNLYFDNDTKQWYTYASNPIFKLYAED